MSILEAIVYGILQGLGEFRRYRAQHISLAPWFRMEGPGLAFDIACTGHAGGGGRILPERLDKSDEAGLTNAKSFEGRLFWYIVLACVPGGILGLLFEEYVETTFRNPLLIGIMLMAMGIVIYLADKYSKAEIELMDIGPGRSFLIGVSQALAMIPGVSRSGITMAAGRAMKIKREDAARSMFLLSTPFIFLSGVYKKDLSVFP